MGRRKRHIGLIIQIDVLILIIILNYFAWKSREFCDFYVTDVYPLWVRTYGKLTALTKASVGEWMIIVLICYLMISIVMIIPSFMLRGKRGGHIIKCYYLVGLHLILPVILIMTLNCTILYHCTKMTESVETEDHTEEIVQIYSILLEHAEELSTLVTRDMEGNVLYTGDMKEDAILYMQNLESDYSRLGGFYPITKDIRNSWFLSQQYIQGYFFPFSMESNINSDMYIMNKPFTICHELAHIKGYIYEDEANYLAYLACIKSDNPVFEYSAYLQVLPYLADELREAVSEGFIGSDAFPKVSEQVKADAIFLSQEAWDEVEAKSPLKTETVNSYTDSAMETSLKLNGVTNGMKSYGEVVLLLLDYYSQNGDIIK